MLNSQSLPDFTEEDLSIVPLERAETIPSSWYWNPAFHQLEQECIFGTTWQAVGHISKLRHAGDQIVATVAGNPILVVRGSDHELRAFFNVCRHRGGPIATEDCTSKVLQCKYHGWTYLLDGSLRGTPKFDRTELFDKKDYGLLSVPLEVWEGVLFVNLSRDKPGISSLLHGIKERIAPNDLSIKTFHHRAVYEINCNWKVYVDNYLEGYHIPYVHPELATLLDYQQYVTETSEYYSLQHSPLTGKNTLYGSGGSAFYYFIFPNFMLNILPGRLQTNVVVPLSPNRTKVIFDYLYDDISSEAAHKMIADDIECSHKVQLEDVEICEHVQLGLQSQAYHKGRFSPDAESGVYHFQSLLKRHYRQALSKM